MGERQTKEELIGKELSWSGIGPTGDFKKAQGKQARYIKDHPEWIKTLKNPFGGNSYFETIEDARKVFEEYWNDQLEVICIDRVGVIVRRNDALGYCRNRSVDIPSNVYKIEGKEKRAKIYPVEPSKYV